MIKMSDDECNKTYVGEAVTLATILTVLAIAIVTVVVYKLFMSSKGSTTLPGGYKFEWK